MNATYSVVLALHLFANITWLGGLLVIARGLGMVPEEVGAARERFIVAAKRLLVGVTMNAGLAILFGVVMVIMEPGVLGQGWFHGKLLLVAILLFYHVRLWRRVRFLEDNPSAATRREFTIVYAVVSALMLGILVLAIVKPF
jgi:protoporphyrinogen IX oxidase